MPHASRELTARRYIIKPTDEGEEYENGTIFNDLNMHENCSQLSTLCCYRLPSWNAWHNTI